ncbi:unnamed protein product [Camellia sinensis]
MNQDWFMQSNNFDPRAAAANFPSGVQAYLAGLTFALAVSPCSTAVLATLLGYVAASKGKGHRVMTVSPRYDQYKDAWDTHVLLQIKIGDQIETIRFFHCYKRGVDRVFVDHPMFLEKIIAEKMVLVACGWRHTISVSSSGGLYTYGWSKYGQLGHGDFEDHLIPHRLEALHENFISQISGGWRHTMALTSDGKLYGWGWNKLAVLGGSLLGTFLSEKDREYLFPMADIVTPNLKEPSALLGGVQLETVDDMRSAAKSIHDMGPRNVLVKGGDLASSLDAVDIFFEGDNFYELRSPRIRTRNTHGTGCTLASCIAAELAKGSLMLSAVKVHVVKSDSRLANNDLPVDIQRLRYRALCYSKRTSTCYT